LARERFDPHVLCLTELLCFNLDSLDYGFAYVVESVHDNGSVPDDKNFLLHDHDDKPFRVCLDAQPLLDSALGCELVPYAPTLHNLAPMTAAHAGALVSDDKHFLLHAHDDKILCFRTDALRRAFGPDVPMLHYLEPSLADLHDNDTSSADKPFLQNDPNDEMPDDVSLGAASLVADVLLPPIFAPTPSEYSGCAAGCKRQNRLNKDHGHFDLHGDPEQLEPCVVRACLAQPRGPNSGMLLDGDPGLDTICCVHRLAGCVRPCGHRGFCRGANAELLFTG